MLKKYLQKLRSPAGRRAQSFVELALVLPVLILLLLGVVEMVIFIGRYLDGLDLTREAARFASVRDPFDNPSEDCNCSTAGKFSFYYDTACVFSPPETAGICSNPDFCNGLNSYFTLNRETDDVVISVYTVTNGAVSDVWPKVRSSTMDCVRQTNNGYWALSDHDNESDYNSNWQRDCNGNVVRSTPYYTLDRVTSLLDSNAPPNKGFVAVELYYCHEQVLGLPMFTLFVPNPIQIHAYTLMPLPAAAPTATPRPTVP
jgi:hypothetical protein